MPFVVWKTDLAVQLVQKVNCTCQGISPVLVENCQKNSSLGPAFIHAYAQKTNMSLVLSHSCKHVGLLSIQNVGLWK